MTVIVFRVFFAMAIVAVAIVPPTASWSAETTKQPVGHTGSLTSNGGHAQAPKHGLYEAGVAAYRAGKFHVAHDLLSKALYQATQRGEHERVNQTLKAMASVYAANRQPKEAKTITSWVAARSVQPDPESPAIDLQATADGAGRVLSFPAKGLKGQTESYEARLKRVLERQ